MDNEKLQDELKERQPETVEEQIEITMEFFKKWLDDLEIGSENFSEQTYENLRLNAYFDMFQYHQQLIRQERQKQREQQEQQNKKIIVPDANKGNVVEGNFNK